MKKSLLFCFLFIFCLTIAGSNLYSQNTKKDITEMLGANNIGNDFWITIPPCFEDESGGFENFIKIFVASTERTLVTVEVPGKGFINTQYTIPNNVIEFNISPVDGQPYVRGCGRDPETPEQVYPGAGIHISSELPVVVYAVVRYHFTSDGFVALPVSSLGTEYVVQGYSVDPMFRAVWNYHLPNITGIIAAFDDTQVNFVMGGNAMSQTAGGLQPGQSITITLDQGDVWMFSSKGDGADLSGSRIISDKPVAVVTGNQCANIPNGNQWCDYTCEMEQPSYTWSHDYHVVDLNGRKYPSIIRIFAKEPATTIFRDGIQIGYLENTNGTMGNGWLEMRVNNMDDAESVRVISADKPIAVTFYNTGVQEDGYPGPSSDPFEMALTPFSQYQREILFCTPGVGGSGFSENYIYLVYETDENGNMPDDVMFKNETAGTDWVQVNTSFPGNNKLFTYLIDGKQFAQKIMTLPGDGVYRVRAANPFAAYSVGYSDYDSYGYPAAAAYMDEETNDTIQPKIEVFSQIKEGESISGKAIDYPEDAANRSNLAMAFFNAKKSNNFEFTTTELIPGVSSAIDWNLKVIDKERDAHAEITFTDRRGNDTTVSFSYKGITSIDEYKDDLHILVSPIPAVNDLEIIFDYGRNAAADVEIYNASGVKVLAASISEETNRYKMDVSSLPSGIYYLKVHSADLMSTRKITIVH